MLPGPGICYNPKAQKRDVNDIIVLDAMWAFAHFLPGLKSPTWKKKSPYSALYVWLSASGSGYKARGVPMTGLTWLHLSDRRQGAGVRAGRQ